MRNGDYAPTRLQAQNETANYIINAKIQGNQESTCGILSMAGERIQSHSSPCRSMGSLMTAMTQDVTISGVCNFVGGLKVAKLALKNRVNKNQRQRIVLFVGSPLNMPEKELVKVGKALKKDNVAVDVINFGAENSTNDNVEKLEKFIAAVNSSDNSHLVNIPPGPHILSDLVLTSAIMSDGSSAPAGGSGAVGGAGAGAGVGAFADSGGVDPSMDPELAMVLRISMEEERQRQEREQKAAADGAAGSAATESATETATPAADATATPATPAAAAADAKPAGDAAPTTPAAATTEPRVATPAEVAAAVPLPMDEEDDEDDDDDDSDDDEAMLAQAIAMSIAAAGGAEDTPAPETTTTTTKPTTTTETPAEEDDGIAEAMKDENFLSSLLESIPGMDTNDLALDDILANLDGGGEEENKDQK